MDTNRDRECTRIDPPTQSLRRDRQRTTNESAFAKPPARQAADGRRWRVRNSAKRHKKRKKRRPRRISRKDKPRMNANGSAYAKRLDWARRSPTARQAANNKRNPPSPSLRRDRPQMNQPTSGSRRTMAGRLRIYAD